MDFAEARVFADSLLCGPPIAGWELVEYLSHGKSAVVMRARRGEATAVVKVFHPGLIEQYGRDAQLIRVKRERELIDKHHANIVRVLDAGNCDVSGHIFVVMGIVPGRPLSRVLSSVARTNIKALVEQLARAARQLEDWGLTHRDIKPDNIHVTDEAQSSLTLLDFGVLKPHGDDSATRQQASKAFVGTHQYSPPEMIHGREEDSLNGWRAITFYQIGAVLHDLIARRPIFESATVRHADLVAAIDNVDVVVTADDVDPRLCNLATRCLLKDPRARLELVRWEDFMFSEQEAQRPSLRARKDALLRQLELGRALNPVDPIEDGETRRLREVRLSTLVRSARTQFDQALAELGGLMPPRTTRLDGGAHPDPAVTYTFAAAPTLRLVSPFRIQIGTSLPDERGIVDVYARASIGLVASEVGWTHLGAALESLDGIAETFEEWTLAIIQEMTGQQ